MTIYLMIDGCKTVKAFENIKSAKTELDAYMFNLCKQGYHIVSSRDGEFSYNNPKNVSMGCTLLRLTEVELVK